MLNEQQNNHIELPSLIENDGWCHHTTSCYLRIKVYNENEVGVHLCLKTLLVIFILA